MTFSKKLTVLLLASTAFLFADKEIVLKGNQRVEKDTILSYVNELSDKKPDDILKRLFETGFFSEIKVKEADGNIIIELTENPMIHTIQFEGNSQLKDDKLSDEIQIKSRDILSKGQVQAAVQKISELYKRIGYLNAQITPKIINLDQNRVNLIFEIKEGEITYIDEINFIGNENFTSNQLQAALLSKRRVWYRFFASDHVYDPVRFEADKSLLKQFYFDHGYPDFEIKSAVAELSPDQKHFILTFGIQEGDPYDFGTIKVDSKIRGVDEKELLNCVLTNTGDTFNGTKIEKSIEKITNILGSKGFAFASVEPVINKEDKKVHLTYMVKEGPRIYLERINIIGNDRTLDSVIRREITLQEGDVYNVSRIKKSEINLKNLEYFKKIDFQTEQGSLPDRAVLNVIIEEEPSTGELDLKGGWSSVIGPIGSIAYKNRNFMGTGRTVHTDFTLAKKALDFDIGMIQPYLFGRTMAGGFDLFNRRSSRLDAYTFYERGLSLSLAYPLTEEMSQSWVYSINKRHLSFDYIDNSSVYPITSASLTGVTPPDNLLPRPGFILQNQAGGSVSSSLTHTFTWDKRDSAVDPTEGYFASLNTSVAGFGGSVYYIKNVLNGKCFYPLTTNITGFIRLEAGHIDKLKSSNNIRVSDSFMLGGHTLRGFAFGGVSPRDLYSRTFDGEKDPIGGTRYWTASAECLFPLGLPKELDIKGALFFDAGAVWKPGKAGWVSGTNNFIYDDRCIRTSAGVGINWKSPFGPIQLDYGIPLKAGRYDQKQRILFGYSTRL